MRTPYRAREDPERSQPPSAVPRAPSGRQRSPARPSLLHPYASFPRGARLARSETRKSSSIELRLEAQASTHESLAASTAHGLPASTAATHSCLQRVDTSLPNAASEVPVVTRRSWGGHGPLWRGSMRQSCAAQPLMPGIPGLGPKASGACRARPGTQRLSARRAPAPARGRHQDLCGVCEFASVHLLVHPSVETAPRSLTSFLSSERRKDVRASLDSKNGAGRSHAGRVHFAEIPCIHMQIDAPKDAVGLRPLLTAPEVAAVLAISLRKFEQLIAANDAPVHLRVGRLRRWRASDVQAWIADRAKPQQ